MKKLRWFAITLFLLSVVLYALDQNQIRRKTDQTIPKISMDQDEIQVSVKDPEKVWKKGITAYDEKDGDITDSLVIESVSTFLEKGRRLVSYAAFDRDGHVAKASRQLIYTDYHSPKISCAKPFSFPRCYQQGGSLLHCPSTLTGLWPAVYFCCTVPGVASAGRYPASCPVKPGLSSSDTFRFASRDHLSYSQT